MTSLFTSRRSRRSLSPLVTTAILITAGILGGLLLYQYFSNVMTAMSTTEAVSLEVIVQNIGLNTKFHYKITNMGTKPIVLRNVTILNSQGGIVHTIPLGNAIIQPGDTYKGVDTVNQVLSDVKYAILHYSINGVELETPAVKITWR